MTIDRKSELAAKLLDIEKRISRAVNEAGRSREEITLVVVTKTFPLADAQLLYELGIRDFGENRDQEGAMKAPQLPADARWHFQGQIQSRKITSICEWADVVHSLDSLDHAAKIAQRPHAGNREYFLQVNVEEGAEHRGGISPRDIPDFIEKSPLTVSGLMVVAPLNEDPLPTFHLLAALGREVNLPYLSMGMSGDFEEAISAGATHIRVGSSILGSRPPLT